MSQRFNPKIEEMKQNSPAASGYEPETEVKDYDPDYPTYGNVRNICFAWPDGKKMFLNYAYLISCAYNAEESSLAIVFSTHSVAARGVNLEPLFFRIMGQKVRLLQCTDPRYNSIGTDRAIINEILVTAAN